MSGPKISFQLLEIIIAVVFVFIYLRYFERRTLFYPMREMVYSPKDLGMDFEDVFFKTADNLDINGWFIPGAGAADTVLFCPGNAGNISHRFEKIRFFHELGLNVFIFDYRGYGRSKGSPSEKGLYADARGAYNYLLAKKIGPQQIIGFGESLGGAVVIDLAANNKLKALIVESSFSSIVDMAKINYPLLPYWIFSSRFESAKKVKTINTPKLIIHSSMDEIVPFKIGRRLYDAASAPKEFLEIRGGHNTGFYESESVLKSKIKEFLNKR